MNTLKRIDRENQLVNSFITDTIALKGLTEQILKLYELNLLNETAMKKIVSTCNYITKKYTIEKNEEEDGKK